MKLFSTLAVTGAVAFAGCGGDDEQQQAAMTEPTPTEAEATPEATQSEVTFASPTDGQTVSGHVRVSVDVSGFEIDPENVGKQPEAGKGHLHFTMDGGEFDKPKYSGPNGALAVKLGVDGKYSPAVAPRSPTGSCRPASTPSKSTSPTTTTATPAPSPRRRSPSNSPISRRPGRIRPPLTDRVEAAARPCCGARIVSPPRLPATARVRARGEFLVVNARRRPARSDSPTHAPASSSPRAARRRATATPTITP